MLINQGLLSVSKSSIYYLQLLLNLAATERLVRIGDFINSKGNGSISSTVCTLINSSMHVLS